MVAEGLEDTHNSPAYLAITDWSGAESGALDPDSCHSDSMLARLLELWPSLPLAIRESIIRAASEGLADG